MLFRGGDGDIGFIGAVFGGDGEANGGLCGAQGFGDGLGGLTEMAADILDGGVTAVCSGKLITVAVYFNGKFTQGAADPDRAAVTEKAFYLA